MARPTEVGAARDFDDPRNRFTVRLNLPANVHSRLSKRAAGLNLTIAQYIRRFIDTDDQTAQIRRVINEESIPQFVSEEHFADCIYHARKALAGIFEHLNEPAEFPRQALYDYTRLTPDQISPEAIYEMPSLFNGMEKFRLKYRAAIANTDDVKLRELVSLLRVSFRPLTGTYGNPPPVLPIKPDSDAWNGFVCAALTYAIVMIEGNRRHDLSR